MNLETVELMKLAFDMAKTLQGQGQECDHIMGRTSWSPGNSEGYTFLDVYGHVLTHLQTLGGNQNKSK